MLPENKKHMKDLRRICCLEDEKHWKQIGLTNIIAITIKTLKEPVFQSNEICHNIHLYIRNGEGTYTVGEYEYILEDNPPKVLLTFLQSNLDVHYREAFIRNVRKYVLSLPDDTTTNGV